MTEDPVAEQRPVYLSDWRWNSQAPPPINGQIRTNSQDWSVAATHLFVANLTDGGVDMGAQLRQIIAGTTLDVAMKTDATRNVRFTATAAPVMRTEEVEAVALTYVDIPVTFVTFSGSIPNSGTLVSFTMTIPTPPATSPITWKVQVLAGRPNRFNLTCSCPHGSVVELCGTRMGGQPIPPQTTIESTAMNLLRKTGCTCSGLVAGTELQGDAEQQTTFEEIVDAVGL